MKKAQQYNRAWEAVENELIRGQNLWLRSKLQSRIVAKLTAGTLTQAKMAALLNITQPRVCALLQGKVEQFRLDSLVDIAHRLGLSISLEVEP